MKRLVIYSALALLVGALVLRLLQYDTGYVLIVIAGKSIEMRFWAAVLLLLLLVGALYFVLKYLSRLTRLTRDVWYSLRYDRAMRAQHRLEAGVLHLLEGDDQAADFMLSKALKRMPKNRLAIVAASESALRLNHLEQAKTRLHTAGEILGEKHLSVALAKTRILIHEQRWQEALQRLLELKTVAPRHPVVIKRLIIVLQALEDWPALESLLQESDRSDVMSEEQWRDLRVNTFRQLLLSAAEAKVPLTEVEQVWTRIPKTLKSQPSLLAVYCRLMLGMEQTGQLEKLLKDALKRDWNDELVEIYGVLPAADPLAQLSRGERWLEQHPEDPTLLLALGRISLRNELWGKAREYFTACLRLSPVPVVYAELARLLARLGDHQQSAELYRQGLLGTAPSLPNLPMPETSRLQ